MVTATTHETLTQKQADILRYMSDQPLPPTYREIAAAFGIAINAVSGHVKALERKGFVKRNGKSRSISVVGGPRLRDLQRLLSHEPATGEEITIGRNRYRLQYLRPATTEEMA